MKDLFIPYKLAVIAKKKGFNEPCLGYFDNDDKEFRLYNPALNDFTQNDVLLCPLYQQIVDWLRANHKILIVQEKAGTYSPIEFRVYQNNSSKWFKYVNIEEQYYSVFNNAIEEAFKLI